MIKSIKMNKYRKLKDITFSFSNNVNVISGTNGTCKTSLLHLISNSVQELNKKCPWIKDISCLNIIRGLNNSVNPKVESLTKGDKKYNDPAPGYKGTLFTVEYFNQSPLEFRRHNSRIMSRYAVKPWYKRDTNDSLPFCPVIYLGLSRLFAFGEFQNDAELSIINKKFPDSYQEEVVNIYKDFTQYDISSLSSQMMGNIKKRTEFSSDIRGIDSNTISAGEDNLMIILMALMSLRFYFENIISSNDVESILLIDELDATLHPYYQIRLLNLFIDYSMKYKIQFFFTTHSLSLIEESLKKKNCHVEYLIDGITNVIQMHSPDIFKIKLNLTGKLKQDVYTDICIPIFTEDEEARLFLEILFNEIAKRDDSFSKIKKLFYPADMSVGADNLRTIFKDSKLFKSAIRAICILDGDKNGEQDKDINNQIMYLPGKDSPEIVAFKHLQALINSEDAFWESDYVSDNGLHKTKCNADIISRVKAIESECASNSDKGKSNKGIRREKNKELFNDYIGFFKIVLFDWIIKHEDELFLFADKLHIMFLKVANYHGVNSDDWKVLSDELKINSNKGKDGYLF